MPFLLALLVFCLPTAGAGAPAGLLGSPSERAIFALIVGVNKSVDIDAPVLRYADDDAAKYVDLFRSLGARSYVLTRLDDNTRRLHQQVAAEAEAPVLDEYTKVVETLASDIRQARQRNVKTVVYFVYAGHGNVRDGRGYITLEDARIDGSQLETDVLTKINADQTHFIVDACHSYFLALGRGPGGRRRELHGITEFGGLAAREDVGLLFSTSSAKESHEWAGFQAGVFSHEVRSGLYGAADADGDGQVSYKEIAAFIERANASVANEKYRSDVFAHPPRGSDILMDLRNRAAARIEVRGARSDHYFLEDSRGIRFADFHNDVDQRAYLIRPLSAGRLYLRRPSDESEFVIPNTPPVVMLANLMAQEPRSSVRGAANDAFESLFALPFNQRVVDGFRFEEPNRPTAAPAADDSHGTRVRKYAGISLFSVGVIGAAAAVYTLKSAQALSDDVGRGAPQSVVSETNERIQSRVTAGTIGLAAAGTAAAAGILLLLWPDSPSTVTLDPSSRSASVSVHARF